MRLGWALPESSGAPVDQSTTGSAGTSLSGTVPRLTSDTLLRGARELLIEHQGELYRLRLTGNNKLILTK